MKTLRPIIILFFAFFVTFCEVSAQVLKTSSPLAVHLSAERLNRIDKVINQYIADKKINGAVAFIARDGKIAYEKAFGMNDVAAKRPLKTDDIFRIASQTKAVTSVAVMMLFEEGKFLLDDPVSKYIPAFAKPTILSTFNSKDSSYTSKPAKREITIRDLLTHTSGIDYAGIGNDTMKAIYAKAGIPAGFLTDKISIQQTMDKLGKLPLIRQPGTKFIYSLSIDVLGRLVEVASGMSLDAFFRTRIFEPLNMKDTYFYIPRQKQNRLVLAYTENKEHQPIPWSDKAFPGLTINYPKAAGTYYSGGAGLSSTVEDYAAFLQMLINGGMYNGKRLLSGRTVDLMTTDQLNGIPFGGNGFGLGFMITSAKGQKELGVSEGSFSWGGFYGTTYWADPKEKMVCMIFLQQWPLSTDIHNKFKAMVYQALDN